MPRPVTALALGSVAVILLVLASQVPHESGIIALDQFLAPHPPATAPHETVDQAWAELAAHAPKAPQWLAQAEARGQPAKAAVDAAHRQDPNFPVESPSAARQDPVQHVVQKAEMLNMEKKMQQMEHQMKKQAKELKEEKKIRAKEAKQLHQHSSQEAEAEGSEGEWQNLRNKMYRAVDVFHKYGDFALEKLIPKQSSKAMYTKAKDQADKEIKALELATKAGGEDDSKANSALKHIEKQLKLQAKMKRDQLKAKEDGKIAAERHKAQDLEKQLKLSEARDHRREKMIQKEVTALSKENQLLREKDNKVSMQLEKVPAIGRRADELASLKNEIHRMEHSESHDVKALKDKLGAVEGKNRLLAHALVEERHALAAAAAQRHRVMAAHREHKQLAVDDLRRDDAEEMMEEGRERSSPVEHEEHHAVEAVAPRRAPVHREEGNFNAHLPEMGFAHTDSSLGCEPCYSGPDCHAGCRLVKAKPDGITLRQVDERRVKQGNMLREFGAAVPLGAKAHMPEGEEWGFNHRHCPAGGCDALEDEGVKVDGWGVGNSKKHVAGMHRAIPSVFSDPASNIEVRRQMNQRQGRFKVYDHSDEEGVYTPPVTWGAAARFFGHDNSPGAQKLEAHGVLMDAWPNDIYSTVPIPMFDKSVWDHDKNQGFTPKDAVKFNRDSNRPMEKAGVRVNKWPSDSFEGEREMPTMDGMADHMVPNQHLPKFRKKGVAEIEKPLHFLLRPHANMAAAQPTVDWKHGVEDWHEDSLEGKEPGQSGYRTVQDTLGCGPQGCFD